MECKEEPTVQTTKKVYIYILFIFYPRKVVSNEIIVIIIMTIDLVGKLHRTIYIANCPSSFYEDLARLIMHRCGAVEAWDVLEDGRMVIVFESMNTMSNALTFHGISFVDLTTKLIVWRAKDPPPAGAPQQCAIAAPSGPSDGLARDSKRATKDGSGDYSSSSSSSPILGDEDRQKWWEKRQHGKLTIQQLAEAAQKADEMSKEGKEARLKALCYRQAKALVTILGDAVEKSKVELEEKKCFLAAATSLLHSIE